MVIEKINSSKDVKKLSFKQLRILVKEIREFLLQSVADTGGHLASNLGVVELTVALHYVFDIPKDKIIWDVGHQSYIHKILTGRKDQFVTLRKFDGLSGFPKPAESDSDSFITGHASTSLSLAAGFAVARDLKHQKNNIIAVIGDGALTGGLAYEGLNNLGHLKKNVIVILNTNEMSISNNVGAISYYIDRIITGRHYNQMKLKIEKMLRMIPGIGNRLLNLKNRLTEAIKSIFVPGILFEELGFLYIGAEDGHNLELLIKRLKKIKSLKGDRPILYHIYTKKGKGYIPAEKQPAKFHGIPKFDISTGETLKKEKFNYTDVFSKTIVQLAQKDERIVAITAAMPEGTGLHLFQKKFPHRFFDVGIAEQHAVTFAAALAKQGLKPVVAIYSTFLQRAYDQLIHDVGILKLPVKFFIDRAGIVGEDGETHQGLFDISYLRSIPGYVIMSPKNGSEFMDLIFTALNYDKGPICVRYPRYNIPEDNIDFSRKLKKISIGTNEILICGHECIIFAAGTMVQNSIQAINILKQHNIIPSLINLQTIYPIDENILLKQVNKNKHIFIIEENVMNGGVGEYLLTLFNKLQIQTDITLINAGNNFIPQGTPDLLRDKYGLSPQKIAQTIMDKIFS